MTIFETVDCRFFENPVGFDHKLSPSSSVRTADNNPAGKFDLRLCETLLVCAVVRSHVVCMTLNVIYGLTSHLLLTCDNDIISPSKHLTAHPHLNSHDNTAVCN